MNLKYWKYRRLRNFSNYYTPHFASGEKKVALPIFALEFAFSSFSVFSYANSGGVATSVALMCLR